MINDADKYKNEDDLARNKMSARHSLETYAYSVKHTMTEAAFKEKTTEQEQKTLAEKVAQTIQWLDKNQTAEQEEVSLLCYHYTNSSFRTSDDDCRG